MTGSTSSELLRRARRGEAPAWDELVARYAPLVHGWCVEHGLGHDDAADVFQEVFQSAARGLAAFESRPGASFRGWLRVITTNKVRDSFRRGAGRPRAIGGSSIQRRIEAVPFEERSTGSTAPRSPSEQTRRVRDALARVRAQVQDHTWAAFERTVLDGASPAAVAEELGMSAVAVRVAKSRVLQRLRRELESRGSAGPEG